MNDFNLPSSKSGVFVTGTNTHIGKTFVSSLMLMAALSNRFSAYYFKPIQTGLDSDSEIVQSLSKVSNEKIMPLVYSFPLPATPYLAAKAAHSEIDLHHIVHIWQELPIGYYIVEGAGGLMAPVWKNQVMRDVIKALDLPIIIVAGTALGTMNHTLLTIEAAKKVGIPIRGIILSGEPYHGLKEILEEFSEEKVLVEIPQINQSEFSNLLSISKKYFSKELLMRIFNAER